MPLTYAVDHATRHVLVTGTDPMRLTDFLEVLERQAVDSAWSYARLVDLRGVVVWTPTLDELSTIVHRVHALGQMFGPRGPVAFVVDRNPYLLGALRMFGLLAEEFGETVAVFRTPIDAAQWLTCVG